MSTLLMNNICPRNQATRLGLLFVLLAAAVGCPSTTTQPPRDILSEVAESSWEDQMTAVRSGQSERIAMLKTAVSDDQFAQLANLSGLQQLICDQGGFDQSALSVLPNLPDLISIRVKGVSISDEAFQWLAQAPALQIINLPEAQVSAAGISSLANHPQIRLLRIHGRLIDDQACHQLQAIPSLNFIHLIGPQISAAGLQEIAKVQALQSLYIDYCSLPSDAWEDFFKARPDVHVHLDQWHHDLDPNQHQH